MVGVGAELPCAHAGYSSFRHTSSAELCSSREPTALLSRSRLVPSNPDRDNMEFDRRHALSVSLPRSSLTRRGVVTYVVVSRCELSGFRPVRQLQRLRNGVKMTHWILPIAS